MNVKWYLSDLHACGHVRGEIVARVLNASGEHRVDCKTAVMLSDFPGTDVMVFQRQHSAKVFDRLLDAKELGIPTVFDIDDDLFDLPPGLTSVKNYYEKPEVQRMLQLFLSHSDLVITSTDYLAAKVQTKTAKPVVVVENGLDLNRWLMPKVLDDNRIVIGWMASSSHRMDAPLIELAMARIMAEHPEVELTLIGWVGLDELSLLRKFSGRIKTMNWQGIDILPTHLADFSIGICPLIDNEFNRSKSGLKALQYWASSTPVVCSLSPAYECVTDGKTGLIAATEEDWYLKLKQLVTTPALRKELGANGRKLLESKYDIRTKALEWIAQFKHARTC